MLRAVLSLTFLTFFWMISKSQAISPATYHNATKTISQLTDSNNYDNRLRPLFQGDPLNITVYTSVMTLGPISEINMEYSLDVLMYQKWTDERLENRMNHKLVLRGDKKNVIWLPDTFFKNVKSAHFHKVPSDESKVEIFPDGRVIYTTRIALKAACEMNFRRYPLDSQNCYLQIQSFANTMDELDYRWDGIEIVNKAMAEFTLGNVSNNRTFVKTHIQTWGVSLSDETQPGSKQNDETCPDCKSSHPCNEKHETFCTLFANFQFNRGLEYSFIQIYAPTCLIVILSWLNFWITLDAVPARSALGITTVLTIVTLMGSVRVYVPKVSYVKAIDFYLIVSFAFVFASILEFVCATLHDGMKKRKRMRTAVCPAPEEEEEEEVKSQSNSSASTPSTPVRHKSDDIERGSDSDDSDLGAKKAEDLMRKQVENVGFLLKSFQSNVRSKTNTMKDAVLYAYVRNDADVIDRMSRVFFPIFYAGFNALYWTFYLGPWDIISD